MNTVTSNNTSSNPIDSRNINNQVSKAMGTAFGRAVWAILDVTMTFTFLAVGTVGTVAFSPFGAVIGLAKGVANKLSGKNTGEGILTCMRKHQQNIANVVTLPSTVVALVVSIGPTISMVPVSFLGGLCAAVVCGVQTAVTGDNSYCKKTQDMNKAFFNRIKPLGCYIETVLTGVRA